MSTFFQFKSLVTHWLDKVDDHSVHSPFYFDFYNTAVKAKSHDKKFEPIEEMRKRLLKNDSALHVTDLGSKSPHFNGSTRKISRVAATSLSPQKYCALYYRIAEYLKSERILELGTSFGITTLYLSAKEKTKVFTFEGNPDIIGVAQTNFEFFERKNIKIIEGNLDSSLSDFLQDPTRIDFVLMDANHRYQPTIQYFNLLCRRMSDKGVIVVDDIHQSSEMERAWEEMKDHDLVYGSIDLFKCGLLLFDLSLTKQHFVWSL